MTFAGQQARGRIEPDPARARNEGFGPGVQVGPVVLVARRLLVGVQLNQIAGHEACRQAELAQHLGQQPGAVTTRPGAGFERLVKDGKVVRWGVSNFDVDDLAEMAAVPGGENCAANQVYYNLSHRVAERRVVPWCRAHAVTVQAYTPQTRRLTLEGGKLHY